ncbi:hypothetical protein A9Q96_00210 [Rhodobacterales bacterium 52_120_T64]|nr:hypothetical protein A9Q96_00210 [Rhodobacterales bacterium 52_120_T64]
MLLVSALYFTLFFTPGSAFQIRLANKLWPKRFQYMVGIEGNHIGPNKIARAKMYGAFLHNVNTFSTQ